MDFNGRIAQANRNADASYQKYNAYQQQADEAYGKYNNAFDKRQSFGDIYNAARDRYLNTDEINKARTSYQQARGAVDQLNDTINRMPDTIRQQYGGNLTQAQLSRIMQSRQGDNANTMNMLSQNYNNTLQDYTDLANRGMQETQYVAGNQMSDQEKTLDALRNVWSTLLGQRNSAYQMNQQDRGLLANEYGARDKYQLAQDQMALERWKEQQANARAAAQRAHEWSLQDYLQKANASANNAQAQLRAKLAEQQNRADYNKYRFNAKQKLKNTYDAQSSGLGGWLRSAFGDDRHHKDYVNGLNNIMSYDQWAGLA